LLQIIVSNKYKIFTGRFVKLSPMPINYQYPALWRRLAAIIYDTLLVIAMIMVYTTIVLIASHYIFGIEREQINKFVFQLGWLCIVLGFFCFFWQRAGQTLGMRAWRLKIVNKDSEQTPNFYQCIYRCFLAPIGLLLCISVFFNKKRQCLHDQITRTQTILIDKE